MHICKFILAISLTVFFLTNIFGQEPINNPYQPPSFTQSSPEVASFKRYGDIPISLYTGVPEIAIPLYSVKLNDMNVPVNLSYHAGGITIDQEATIVGLGWDLNVGGNIIITPVGASEANGLYSAWEDWKKNIDYVAGNTGGPVNVGREAPGHNWDCLMISEPPFPDYLFGLNIAATMNLGELDLHRVTLPNRSFTFVIHPGTGEPIFVGEKNKCRIERYRINGFLITDETGVKYSFDVIEYDNDKNVPTAWFLDRMTDIYGNEIVFEYGNFGNVGPLPKMSEIIRGYYGTFTPPRQITYSIGGVTNYYLLAIKTNTQRVKFEYGLDRRDLEGPGRRHLKQLTVIDSASQTIKTSFKFNYDYFGSSVVGGDFLDDDDNTPLLTNAKSLRLKLVSVSHSNPLYPNDSLSHKFEYDERHLLPLKTSFAKDFWGFFNGQENLCAIDGVPQSPLNYMHTLLPDPVVMNFVEDDFSEIDWEIYFANFGQYKFANRFPDRDYTSVGTIKSITYPTGGRTEFEFEPHDFRNQVMFEAADQPVLLGEKIHQSVSDLNDPYGEVTYVTPFELSETTKVHLVGGGDSTQFNLASGTIGIIDLNGGPNHMYSLGEKSLWDIKMELPAGSYRLVCSAPADIPFQNYEAIVWATLTYTVFDRDAIASILNRTNGTGGGLRIKRIRNFDEGDNLVGTKEFEYKLENGMSSGRLLHKMDNFQKETITTGWANIDDSAWPIVVLIQHRTDRIDAFNFHSNNFLELRNSTSGVRIGYDRVLVRSIVGDSDLGREVSYFENEPPETIGTHFSLYNHSTNGKLRSKLVFNKEGDTVQYQKFYYSLDHYERNIVNIKVTDTYFGPIGGCKMFYILDNFNRYNVVVYAHTNFVYHLRKVERYDYFGGNKILTISENTYDPINFELDETSTVVSNNRRRITRFKYPHDDPNDFAYSRMIESNWLSPVIEQKEYIDGELLKTIENKFWFWLDNQVLKVGLKRVNIGFGDSPPQEEIVFDKYDSKGNVLQYHKPNENINTVFYRGYGDNRVVARLVSTLNYDEISAAATIYLDQLDDNLTETELIQINDAIRALMPDALVTTYNYDPLFGITSETDPNGRTNYFEYDGFGRLAIVRDAEGNIVRQLDYNYRLQTDQN